MPLLRAVGCEMSNDESVIYLQREDNSIVASRNPARRILLLPKHTDDLCLSLKGNGHYNQLKFYDSLRDYWDGYRSVDDKFAIADEREQLMTIGNFNLFHDVNFKDVSVLGWDIETNGLAIESKSFIYLISNTFQQGGRVIKKTFIYSDYKNNGEMILAWAQWVRAMDPTILAGYNCLKFDFPFLLKVAENHGVTVSLGRDGSDVKVDTYTRQFRKDAGQFIAFNDVKIHGRQCLDLWLLVMKYDTARQFENYKLKHVIEKSGLQRDGRQFYEAGSIAANISDPIEREKIISYAQDDASDVVNLWLHLGEPFFMLARTVPKSLQAIVYSGIGSLWNSMMVREYLKRGSSIPKATEIVGAYQGGISISNPGIYSNANRVDLISSYPNHMLEYGIYDQEKDPDARYLELLETFIEQRIEQKNLYKTTGKIEHKSASDALKYLGNGAYGSFAGPGLAFNSPKSAASVTEKARESLTKGMDFVASKGFVLIHADTDSVTFCKLDQSRFSDEERKSFLTELNGRYPKRIQWEDEPQIDRMLVVKGKNYAMRAGVKVTVKGSGLKGTMREAALKECIHKLIGALLDGKGASAIGEIRDHYLNEIENLADIRRWAFKKSVTTAILTGTRTNEAKLRKALEGSDYVLGDKFFAYFCADESVKLAERWDGDHCKERLKQKLMASMCVVLGKESEWNKK